MDLPGFQTRPFRPARWAPGPHAQTLLARTLRPRPRSDRPRRERLETPDDDFLDLDWWPEPRPDAPLVLVLHGLEGSSARRYVRNACRELARHGVRPVAMNFRGCSGEPNRQPRLYHSGETRDPAYVLQQLRARHPTTPLGALGFSLGGNVLLKTLGERPDGGAALADAAAVVSVPYDLEAGSRHLEDTWRGMGAFYTWYFMRQLRRKVLLKRALLADLLDIERALRSRTLREFDDAVTAPLHGFEGASDYYRRSSSAAFLDGVRVPTLLLHSRDDPFLPPSSIPLASMRSNPTLMPALTDRGGHVGFLAGSPRRPAFWGEEEAARFLSEALAAAVPSTSTGGAKTLP